MTTKKYDVAVKTGTYLDKQGVEKGSYENIGTVLEGEKGPFMVLRRTFNPAGLPNPLNKDSIILSFFEPKTA